MKWIVGLGNPGSRYKRTRHNIGFMAVDRFAKQWGIKMSNNSKCMAEVGEGNVQGVKVVLLKPMTYMNLSGESVRSFMDYFKVNLEDAIILYDDLDTPYGNIRLRYQGSSGGHNGIKSIIQHVGTQSFNRIRIGISRPETGVAVVDYVLTPFSRMEQAALPEVLQNCCDALEHALDQPFEKTMAKYNR